MKQLINKLVNHETLSVEEAKMALVSISKGNSNQSHIASFLTVFMMRSITLQELQGFRAALLELCVPVDLSEFNTIDLCGTGGDGKDTFNISTLASFVTAGAGVKVAKHGNYGISSICGSSNVLEHLGVKFSNNEDFLKKCIDQAGICVLHAPLFHPAMKNVGPVRRELGVKTFFNILGPIVNPSFPQNQIVGVFNLELMRLYSYLYQNTNKNYSIVHSLEGYDEISLTGNAKIITNFSESLFRPTDLGLNIINQHEIFGGNTIKSSVDIFLKIINGKGTEAQNQVVCANAGLAIATVKNITHLSGYELAKESLNNGNASRSLKKLIKISQS
tara:strand:+ start:2486 stop:3481 length:996 start_codon:yes stop_codon:yes gene_type:complete